MKRTKYYAFIAAAALCAGAVSCTKESGGGDPEVGEPVETGYYLSTRADDSGNPQHGDTYTILSYMKGVPTSTHADMYYLRNPNSMLQYGYYAYDGNGTVGATGELVPVAVDSDYKPVDGTDQLVRDQTQGQRLLGVPATGTNSTRIGFYRVAMIHPAIPMRDSEIGYMAVFNRTDKIYASHPDDKAGDGSGDPFEIEVHTNREIHPIEDVVMHPVKAAIRIYLYSLYYNEIEDPQEIEFTVEEIKLINAGSNGWFNARTNIVYPNYNYSDADYRTRYSSKADENVEGQNAENLNAESDDTQIPTSYENIEANAQYKVNDVSVFPTDYRGGEGGGDPRIIPMTLSLKLQDKKSGQYNTAAVPIALEIERNKCYIFYVNVKSKQIVVSYSILGWETGANEDYADIGGDVQTYFTLNMDWNNGGWEDVPGGEEMPIGGN